MSGSVTEHSPEPAVLDDPVRVALELSAVSAGGAVGAVARHLVSTTAVPAGFPWVTFTVNVSGCLLIGVLVVVSARAVPRLPWVRPLLGVGVLGGWTTFSTYALDAQRLWSRGDLPEGVGYVVGTVVAAIVAVGLGVWATERVLRRGIR